MPIPWATTARCPQQRLQSVTTAPANEPSRPAHVRPRREKTRQLCQQLSMSSDLRQPWRERLDDNYGIEVVNNSAKTRAISLFICQILIASTHPTSNNLFFPINDDGGELFSTWRVKRRLSRNESILEMVGRSRRIRMEFSAMLNFAECEPIALFAQLIQSSAQQRLGKILPIGKTLSGP